MSRQRNLIPTYRKHSQTGRAVISVYRADGSRTEILLPGPYGSDESRHEYERVLATLRANVGKVPDSRPAADISVAELVERFMREYAEANHRRPDGTASGELRDFVLSLRPLLRLYSRTPAREFSPRDLVAIREATITASWLTDDEKAKLAKRRGHDGTCARRTANQRTNRIRRIFKWGGEMGIIPASVW